jgi:chondroitin AC lyase
MIYLVTLAVIALSCSAALHASESDSTADLQTLRNRFIHSILPTDPDAIEALKRTGDQIAGSLRIDGSWADIDYTDQQRSTWLVKEHTERLLLMSRAYRLAPERGLLRSIHLALDYWLERDFRNPNWWHNEIGTPQLLSTSAVLLGDEITAAENEKLLAILRRSVWRKWTGQNLVWGVTIQIKRGLIEQNADTITEAFNRLYAEVRITSAEGIQRDFSFHQHGAQLYSGGYGLNFGIDVARFTALSWGTRWEIPADGMEILTGYLLDGIRPMMHGGRIDYSTVGREITRKGKTAVPRSWTGGPVAPVGAAYGLPHAVALLAEHQVPRRDELRSFAATLRGEATVKPPVGNRHFWRSDYQAHQRPGWFASVKMFSTRMINAELINNEGIKSHHLSDGANLLYLTGEEYRNIFPVWDWTRIPGTTAEQGTLDIEEGHEIGIKAKTAFVGGVSDGSVGVAAMDLARGKLAARKAWFFFDDAYVCLGAGITCTSDNPVTTSINQCHLDGDVGKGHDWVHHANVGYVFKPAPSRIELTTGEQTGRWSDIGTGADELLKQKVFNLWLNHGVRPSGATYQYAVLPGATREWTMAYAKDPAATVIANTAALQSVWHGQSKVLGVAFWQAGSVEWDGHTLEVERPCLVLLNLSGNRPRVAAANPVNQPATVTVTLDGQSMTVALPDGDMAGSSVVAHLPVR